MSTSSLLHFLLLFNLALWHLANGSCCCCDCCCCCCPCCCCCGCGSSNNNNNNNLLASLAGTGTAAASDDDLTLGAQTAAAENRAGIGPGLLPDGSTGRTGQQPDQLFGDQFAGTGRRRRGLGRLAREEEEFECQNGCRCRRLAIAMPYESKPKQKPVLPSDWTMSIDPGHEPSIGPGLLPDGSTGRRQRPMNQNFGDFFGNNGMGTEKRRRRRGIEAQKQQDFDCACPDQGGSKADCNSYQLGLVPVDEMQHKNQTFFRFLLGLVPEDQASSQPTKGGGNRKWKRAGGEFTIRRHFIVPVDLAAERKERIGKSSRKGQPVLPKPPLQFYRPVEGNPENEQEKYEADYD